MAEQLHLAMLRLFAIFAIKFQNIAFEHYIHSTHVVKLRRYETD